MADAMRIAAMCRRGTLAALTHINAERHPGVDIAA